MQIEWCESSCVSKKETILFEPTQPTERHLMKIASLSPAKSTANPLRRTSTAERLNSFRESAGRCSRRWAAQRILFLLWLLQGLVPLALQTRSFVNFVIPHKISEKLVAPPDLPKETANLAEECPARAFLLADVWWNHDATHYYKVNNGTICHVVVPQYNTHGNYFTGTSKTPPFHTTPSTCANDSYPFEVYLYHASVGFYSFYQGEVGTYCSKDKTAYIVAKVLGTYDINGVFLSNDTGSTKTRMSYWYGTVGASWLIYRAFMIRRSYLSCGHYGRRCDELMEKLTHHEAMVFVQESLRLSPHGATNYQRASLLYLVVEGVMTDLFLIIANDGWTSRIQYVSLGYNLSGLMLLLFEMVESRSCLKEKWRLVFKRVLFSYEATLVGELVTALALQHFLSGLNASDLKHSRPTALAVSYYVWSLVCHGAVVLVILSIISSVRVLWAVGYVWIKHRSLAILFKSCCVDSTLGVRSRMMLLGGYRLDNGKLYYTRTALKSLGMLKMVENDAEYLVMHKLNWFYAPANNLIVIGVVVGFQVEPCHGRPCTGIVSFLDRGLGGVSSSHHRPAHTARAKVMTSDGIVAQPTEFLVSLQVKGEEYQHGKPMLP